MTMKKDKYCWPRRPCHYSNNGDDENNNLNVNNNENEYQTIFSHWKTDLDNNNMILYVYQDDVNRFKNENIPININGLHFHIGETYQFTIKEKDKYKDTLKTDLIKIISNLPSQITHLYFTVSKGYVDCFPLYKEKNVVPHFVSHLSINIKKLLHPSDKSADILSNIYTPQSITHLTLDFYSQIEQDVIDTIIPPNVKHLYLKQGSGDEKIPQTVTSLQISNAGYHFSIPHSGIQYLRIMKKAHHIKSIYPNVKKLIYTHDYGFEKGTSNTFSVEEQSLDVFDGVFKVYDDNIESTIPTTTKYLLWLSNKLIKPNQIPYGVKSIIFGYSFNEQIDQDCIPSSVEYIKFKGFNKSLSLIHFPSNLKRLCLGKHCNQFVYGIHQLPNTLTHLELYISKYDALHWLYNKGILPRNITHLKLKIKGYLEELIVPSSLKFIDCPSPNISIMDEEEYYKDPFNLPNKSTNTPVSGIKHMVLLNHLALNQTTQLPSSLVSLTIHPAKKRLAKYVEGHIEFFHKFYKHILQHGYSKFDKSIIPTTLQILRCPNIDYIPLTCNNLTLLEYSIKPYIKKIVLVSTDRKPTITISNIPIEFDYDKSVFTPQIVDKVDKLFIETKELVKKRFEWCDDEADQHYDRPDLCIDIRKLSLNLIKVPIGYVPPSVENLVLYSEPKIFVGSIPNTVKVLTYYGEIESCCIPSTIKVLNIELIDRNLQLLKNPIQTKPQQQPKMIKSYSGNDIDLFFRIWRNNILKQSIFEFKYPTIIYASSVDQVIETQNRFRLITLIFKSINEFKIEMFPNNCKNIEGVILDFEVNQDVLSILPNSIKRLSIQNHRNLIIPNWITHLEITGSIKDQFILKSTIPTSVTHLSLFGFKHFEKDTIPSTVKYFELDSIEIIKDSIPSSIISIKFKKLKNYESILTTLTRIDIPLSELLPSISTYSCSSIPEDLLNRMNFQIYDKDIKIKSTTTTLIWIKNRVIQHGEIPNTIKRLIFGDGFNQTILADTIPISVTEIIFGSNFKQDLPNIYLPPSLTSISFEYCWKRDNVNYESLPKSVKYIYMNLPYNRDIIPTLPSNVTHVCLNATNFSYKTPSHVSHIKSVSKRDSVCLSTLEVSTTVKSIQFDGYIKYQLESVKSNQEEANEGEEEEEEEEQKNTISLAGRDTEINLIPRKSDRQFNEFIKPGSLISNIKSIVFGYFYDQIILKGSIPDSVTKVVLNCSKEQFISPPFLKVLDLGGYGDDTISSLPETLEQLTVYEQYHFDIRFFPKNLKIIHFWVSEYLDIYYCIFPDSIEEIHFHEPDQYMKLYNPPSNLKALTISYSKGMFDNLPNSIQELNIKALYYIESFSAKELPRSLTKLTLERNQPIYDLDDLPPNIKYLKLGNYFKGKIPKTVESIEFSSIITIPFDYLFE